MYPLMNQYCSQQLGSRFGFVCTDALLACVFDLSHCLWSLVISFELNTTFFSFFWTRGYKKCFEFVCFSFIVFRLTR
jgi:hypothetical protein